MKSILLVFATLTFSLNCMAQLTYVPDDNFEQALIDLGYDSGPLDNFVPTANIDNITYLSIRDKDIFDLNGIEDFSSLAILDISDNNLTVLNTSNNTNLSSLLCSSNDLFSLDVSGNSALIQLLVDNNNLNTIDVTNNLVLSTLSCSDNNLTSLNVTNNTALTLLNCSSNALNNLDVKSNTQLEGLYCTGNYLTSLNLRQNFALEVLFCYSNDIDRLNLSRNPFLRIVSCFDNNLIGLNIKNGKNTRITAFAASSNPNLTCIQVDDPAYSELHWTSIDPASSFSEGCRYSASHSRIAIETEEQYLSVFPNPVIDVMTINSEAKGHYSLMNSNGQILMEGMLIQGKNDVDLSRFAEGLYLLQIQTASQSIIKKLLKQ